MERIWTLISLKLSSEATEAELNELQLLLLQDSATTYKLEIIEEIWNFQPNENKQYSEHQYKMLLHKMEEKGINMSGFNTDDESSFVLEDNTLIKDRSWYGISYKKVMFSALSVLGACLIAGSFFFYFNTKQSLGEVKSYNIITKDGNKTTFIFPDGTKVWVNAGSKLTYDNKYDLKTREVYLSGEAFFEVRHNAEKPFIIHTDKMDITDLGTVFNVRCYSNEKKSVTSLINGSIEISLKNRPKEKIYLKPAEKLTLIDDATANAKTVSNNNKNKRTDSAEIEPLVAIGHVNYLTKDNSVVETSWVNDKLVFQGETFEEIALKMERWYGIRIVIVDDKLKHIHFTGAFNGETINQALSALQLTTPFTYVTNMNNSIIITTKKQT